MARLSLVDKYRPVSLSGIFGQQTVVKILGKFVAEPYSTGFLFHGETGTGKTSAALAMANELGCDIDKGEMGGVWSIPSGEQSVQAVRELVGRMHYVPFYGSGWKVIIVNEADIMSAQTEAVWLDVLEALPNWTVVIFTTNNAKKMSDRFKDRCRILPFASAIDSLGSAVADLIRQIWKAETGRDDAPKEVPDVARNGHVSFRRLVNNISLLIDAA